MATQLSYEPLKKKKLEPTYVSDKKGLTEEQKNEEFVKSHSKLAVLADKLSRTGRFSSKSAMNASLVKAYEKYPAIAESALALQHGFLKQFLNEPAFQSEFSKAYGLRASELRACPTYEREIPEMFSLFVGNIFKCPDLYSRQRFNQLYESAMEFALTGKSSTLMESALSLWEDFCQRLNKAWHRFSRRIDKSMAKNSRNELLTQLDNAGLVEFAYLSLTVWKSHLLFGRLANLKGKALGPQTGMKIGVRKAIRDKETHEIVGHWPTEFRTIPMQGKTVKPVAKKSIEQAIIKAIVEAINDIEAKRGAGFVGRIFKANEKFALSQYASQNNMSRFESMFVGRSQDKFSVFITGDNLKKYVKTIGTLGRNDNSMYVLLHGQAMHLQKIARGNRQVYAHALGFDSEKFNKNTLYRVDIAFSYHKHPRLPKGTELGANSFFQWGGFTSGGMREVVQDWSKFNSVEILGVHQVEVV